MAKSRAHRYSIEIKELRGSVLFSTVAYWDGRTGASRLLKSPLLLGFLR